MVIYADVLIVLNIYINCILLCITAKLTHSQLKTVRLLLGSVYGSIYSLTILLPELNNVLSILIKTISAVTIIMVTFGIQNKRRLLINTVTFFTANFIVGGVVYAVYSWLKPEFIHFNNTYFYIDFSLLILIITTSAVYIITSVFQRITDISPDTMYKIIIRYSNITTSIDGLADTGNILTDYFTGSPIIICGENNFELITGTEKSQSNLPKGFRYIPCETVSDSGVIPVFRPDEIIIESKNKGCRKKVNALIGFGKNYKEAVFNPNLLKL